LDQIILEQELKTFRGCSQSKKFWIAGAGTTALVQLPTTANLALGFLSASFLKLVANWSASVVWRFHQSMLMSRRLRNLLRMCSAWLKLAQQHNLWETSTVILAGP